MRADGFRSNPIEPDFADPSTVQIEPSAIDTNELLDELVRWNDVLKPHADALRGPRP